MCLGIPMQVIEMTGTHAALCEGMGEQKSIDMSLVGEQPAGAWLVTFLGAAREVIGAQEALQITDALQAVDNIMQGDAHSVDKLFADIIERGPQLPPHLQEQLNKE